MQHIYHLYLDDSGTRHPDKKQRKIPAHGFDWFSLGGILIKKEHEDAFKQNHQAFITKWNITAPLHSAKIRARSGAFAFLNTLPQHEQGSFYEELYQLMATAPVIGIACVIDRPGYNARYSQKYGRQRWALCKTAFPVVVERAAKYAIDNGIKLRVFLERSDKKTDKQMQLYYDELKTQGLPFDKVSSEKYKPLDKAIFQNTLYEFKLKAKQHPIMQLADLYLWPMCMGGYNPQTRPYLRLMEDKKLIDCYLEKELLPHRGIKYSCWDLRTQNA